MPKISQLPNYTNPQDGDLQVIVDSQNNTTKKISWLSIKNALKTFFDNLYMGKRITRRTYSVNTTNELIPNLENYDYYRISNLSSSITIKNPSGNLTLGETFVILIKDNGTSKNITWENLYKGMGLQLPNATTAGKTMEFICSYDGSNILVSYTVEI